MSKTCSGEALLARRIPLAEQMSGELFWLGVGTAPSGWVFELFCGAIACIPEVLETP
jgi:hypothetical protein